MASDSFRKVLIDLAQKEDADNRIAKILAFYYPNLDLSTKIKLFESLFYWYKTSTEFNSSDITDQIEIETENVIDSFIGKDFRIKSFEISNVRGIPDKDNGIPFGMNFQENSTINNAIILANNGTGKSSVFAGLEMIYAQKIGEKQLRTTSPNNLKQKDYDEYLKRFPLNLKPNCIIHTNEGNYSLDNAIFKDEKVRNVFNPSNHFISDFDIYYNGQIDFGGNSDDLNSFHSIIANSLGLGEFLKFESILTELTRYNRSVEKNLLNGLNKQLITTNKSIEDWEKIIASKLQDLLVLQEKKSSKAGDSIAEERKAKIKELSKISLSYGSDEEQYIKFLSEFKKVYATSQITEKNKSQSLEKDFLEIGTELIHNSDNCPFCHDSKRTVEEIQKEVKIRLAKITESQKVEEELRGRFKDLTNVLSIFFSDTPRIYEFISKERTEIVAYAELNYLLEDEGKLYIKEAPVMSDYELKEFIDSLNLLSYPKENDYKRLFDLINNNQDFFIKEIPQDIQRISNFIKERKDILQKLVDNININQAENTVEKQIAIIEEDIARLKQQIETGKKQIDNLYLQIENVENDTKLVEQIKIDVSEYLPVYQSVVNKLINEAFEPVKEIVETILKDYLEEEGLTFKIDRKEIKTIIDGEEITNKLIVAILEHVDSKTGEIKIITPDVYFNAFRYKLFCLMVSLSLALATRQKYNINLPLVMDDLFYASDFINKHSFSRFINKVIQLFYKYTPNLPLQFIIFTHDDLIFKSAIDSLELLHLEEIEGLDYKCLHPDNQKHLIKKTIIGRFFGPTDKDETPEKLENGQLYWSLLYKLPKNILVS